LDKALDKHTGIRFKKNAALSAFRALCKLLV